jgi:hypothetical protein
MAAQPFTAGLHGVQVNAANSLMITHDAAADRAHANWKFGRWRQPGLRLRVGGCTTAAVRPANATMPTRTLREGRSEKPCRISEAATKVGLHVARMLPD